MIPAMFTLYLTLQNPEGQTVTQVLAHHLSIKKCDAMGVALLHSLQERGRVISYSCWNEAYGYNR